MVLFGPAGLVSLLLWFALSADFENGLWWAFKTPGSNGVTYAVRQDKVMICLVWSVLAPGLLAWCFNLKFWRVFASLVFALVSLVCISAAQVSDAVNFSMLHVVPGPAALKLLAAMSLLFFCAKTLLPVIFAYVAVSRDACPRNHAAIAVAMTLGACALMLWVALYSLLHPGVTWRPAAWV